MTPGALTYSLCWIRDSAFMIHALDKLGFHDQAREKLLDLSGRQEKDGYFVSQEGEWDSNGLVIWAVLEHFKLTGDKQFLSDIYPAVARGAEWIEHKRRGTTGKPSSHSGLLPAGISAEHLGPTDHYYWDNCMELLLRLAFLERRRRLRASLAIPATTGKPSSIPCNSRSAS
jgi:hypothetical protein